jgi:hypothetical protein
MVVLLKMDFQWQIGTSRFDHLNCKDVGSPTILNVFWQAHA